MLTLQRLQYTGAERKEGRDSQKIPIKRVPSVKSKSPMVQEQASGQDEGLQAYRAPAYIGHERCYVQLALDAKLCALPIPERQPPFKDSLMCPGIRQIREKIRPRVTKD